MKVLIETDEKYIKDIIETISSQLDCNRFALNKDGYDIVFDMRDRYAGKGRTLNKNEYITIKDGKLSLLKTEDIEWVSSDVAAVKKVDK